jgi:hypothetical protein
LLVFLLEDRKKSILTLAGFFCLYSGMQRHTTYRFTFTT